MKIMKIGEMAKMLILKGYEQEEIISLVRKEFPGSKISKSSISYYRAKITTNDLVDAGKMTPYKINGEIVAMLAKRMDGAYEASLFCTYKGFADNSCAFDTYEELINYVHTQKSVIDGELPGLKRRYELYG